MDRLDTLQAFVLVAELRSFSGAARRLRRSASSVTRLVAGLEERLGVRLLQRTTRSVALTDQGAHFFERSRRILTELQDAEATAMARRTTPSGRFTISAPAGFGRLHVAPFLVKFLAQYPQVRGELDLADRPVRLVEEGFDVGVRIGNLKDQALVARRVGQTTRLLVAAPAYLEGARPLRNPGQLAHHRLIHLTGLGAVPEWRFQRRGRAVAVRFEPGFSTNSADVAVTHATSGQGVCMVLGYQVAALVKAGALRVLLPEWAPAPLPIQCVWPSARLKTPTLRAFIDEAAAQAWSF